MILESDITEAALAERRRCVGLVLAEYGRWKLAGQLEIADVLDALATAMEHEPKIETK